MRANYPKSISHPCLLFRLPIPKRNGQNYGKKL